MSETTPLYRLIAALVAEHPELNGLEIPLDKNGQRRLLRALMNIRDATPLSNEMMRIQDNELQQQLCEKGVVEIADTAPSTSDGRLHLWQGDITRLKVDAIVNAANSRMLGCSVPNHGCIDNAIHSAAGMQLREECFNIMNEQGYKEPTGTAKITAGYNLPSQYVIHTVGPIIPDGIPTESHKRLLASCYTSCLDLADRHGLHSIAFCCISTGEFRFPNKEATEIAVTTVRDWLSAHTETTITAVIFNVFKDADNRLYKELLF